MTNCSATTWDQCSTWVLGIPNVWLARGLIIFSTMVMLGCTVCLARSKWVPSKIILDTESVKKLLENAVILQALLLAFSVTLPTAVDPDVLQAADVLQLELNHEAPRKHVTWLVSHWFFYHVGSAANYLSTGLGGAFLGLVCLVCLNIEDNDGLTKILMPTLVWLSFLICMGVIHFCYSFHLLVHILAPKSYHLRIRHYPSRGFDLFNLAACFAAFVPACILYKRHQRPKHTQSRTEAQDSGDELRPRRTESADVMYVRSQIRESPRRSVT